MITRLFQTISLLFLLSVVPAPTVAVGQTVPGTNTAAKFRVIKYMGQLDQPIGLTEGSPGVFFTESGSAKPTVFTITPQGAVVYIATFTNNSGIIGHLVGAANGRFYGAITPSQMMFSVSSAPGVIKYPAAAIAPAMIQSLPEGMLFGVGLAPPPSIS